MRINWKLRLQNKVTLVAIVTLIISIIYQVLRTFGIVPIIEQQQVIDLGNMVIDLLALLGIVIDPTTKGIEDSSKAMTYDEPN